PRYVRGRRGTVILRYRPQGFQDDEPIDGFDGPQPMYAVRFDGVELWGDQAETNSSVVLDMWESYLEEEVATDGE
ncbi:MAG: nitrile hydratase subunit beta, partial [Gemmatimonadetes bacterium]|nr:nitrile hydratase subunit beta [Gemmatimonadota bacterium]